MLNIIKNLCGPAYLFFCYAIISIVLTLLLDVFSETNNFNSYESMINYYLTRILFFVLFTYLLNWLCSNGFIEVSWFLLYYPFILLAILLIGSFFIINKLINNNEFIDYLKYIKNK
jgi:dolichyl-phosphate-mannose--protein O-mannosyl transferase